MAIERIDISENSYPNAFYRVGIKAVIKDEADRVLCVHDTGDEDMWSLPGGGLDHGDDVRSGIARELVEEIDYSGDFTMVFRDTCIYESKTIGAFLLYIIYDVVLNEAYSPHPGIDALDVKFMELNELDDYTDRQAGLIRAFGFHSDESIPIKNSHQR